MAGSGTGFDYRPISVKREDLDQMAPFPNKQQERSYESWRQDMIFRVWGPQHPYRPRERQRSSAPQPIR